MTAVSLNALLDSLTEGDLADLIDTESCGGRLGPELIGHVIASNTPLLGWTSVIRALLVGSGSLVKAPSSPNAVWIDYFIDTLRDVVHRGKCRRLVTAAYWEGWRRLD